MERFPPRGMGKTVCCCLHGTGEGGGRRWLHVPMHVPVEAADEVILSRGRAAGDITGELQLLQRLQEYRGPELVLVHPLVEPETLLQFCQGEVVDGSRLGKRGPDLPQQRQAPAGLDGFVGRL